MAEVRDGHGIIVDYIRVSVTDRCNLRCVYCMPPQGVEHLERSELLSFEEITRVVRLASGLGMWKVRITGGEPLVRRNLSVLVENLAKISGITDICLTTNGLLLDRYAGELTRAGLRRVNVSLDSLRPERFREITRGGDIDKLMRGLEAAESAGLSPVRINVVILKGINDDEIEDFARLTLSTTYHVRFIEWMPVGGDNAWRRDRYVPLSEAKRVVSAIAPLEPVIAGNDGPARYFRLQGGSGLVGFISPLSQHFCSGCNRLRLTAEGQLRPCLFSDSEVDLRTPLRSGAADDEIEKILRQAVFAKPERYPAQVHTGLCALAPMSRIGG
jgi:GTP 3',8-cyclase